MRKRNNKTANARDWLFQLLINCSIMSIYNISCCMEEVLEAIKTKISLIQGPISGPERYVRALTGDLLHLCNSSIQMCRSSSLN